MQSHRSPIPAPEQAIPAPGLVEYLAATPAARDGVRVTFLNDWSLHGRLLATHRDGFVLDVPHGGTYYAMAAAVVAVEIRKVRS